MPPHDYFPPATQDCPTFDGDSEWHPIIDGQEYFAALDAELDGVGAGDTVLVSGLSLDPALDLAGRRPGDAGYRPLGERLACAAAEGVHVRVLLAARVLASSIPSSLVGDFRVNVEHARQLRVWQVPGSAQAPLRDSVLLDFCGAVLGSNHQKVVVICRRGALTAFVAGIDLLAERFDAAPHDRLRLRGRRWGWHDAAVRLRGPAAAQVWAAQTQRWRETAALPPRRYYRRPAHLDRLNPAGPAGVPPQPPGQPARDSRGTSVRVLRSMPPRKFDSLLPWRRVPWQSLPPTGVQEIFETLRTAIDAARRYVYLEDQYLQESAGGIARFELYPFLRAAARRGVKVILLGSGTRDPDDPGLLYPPINRTVNADLRTKILDRLDAEQRANVAVHRLEHCTTHAKLMLVDDAFAAIGSANMFSRSMSGVDIELTAAVCTTTSLVRDLRSRLWAEHLRTPLTDELRPALHDLDLALGIWDERWLPAGAARSTWHAPGEPAGFAPAERVLVRVPVRRRR